MTVSWDSDDGLKADALWTVLATARAAAGTLKAVEAAAREAVSSRWHRTRMSAASRKAARKMTGDVPADGAPLASWERICWQLAKVSWDLKPAQQVVAAEKLIEKRTRP